MTYQLYYYPGACSLAAHIVLEELEQDFELRLVSIPDGGTRDPDYLAFNPKGRVPVLAIPGESRPLTELPAILVYLAERHPEGGLLPSDPLARARCGEWLAWLAGWVHGVGFGELWRPQRFAADPDTQAAIQANGKTVVADAFHRIETLIAEQGNTVLSGYTLVDPFLLVLYAWGERIGLPMADAHRTWTARVRDIAVRPAVLRALAREHVEIGVL